MSARDCLNRAKAHLDIAKAHYISAKAVYDSAKTLFDEAQIRFDLSEPPKRTEELCKSCAQLSCIDDLRGSRAERGKRHHVGYLSHTKANESTCRFCCFLIHAARLAHGEDLDTRPLMDSNRKIPLYLEFEEPSKSWYGVAGISTEARCPSYAWLEIGAKNSRLGKHICITFEPAHFTGPQGLRRNLLPRKRGDNEATGGLIDYDLVRSWLKVCESRHGDACRKGIVAESQKMKLNLINVHSRKIEEDSGEAQYIALSYVWGEASHSPHDTISNNLNGESDMERSRLRLPTSLPKTIEDAMSVTKFLGLNHLWVDYFCIDQQNKAELQEQIEKMDLVYQRAHLTIVALDGKNMDAGLPGISRPLSKTLQPIFDTEDGQVMATYVEDIWDRVASKPPWDRRGWTFQEGVLSRRSLIFDQTNVTMRCQQEYLHDSMSIDLDDDRIPTLLSQKHFWDNGYGIDLTERKWNFMTFDALLSVFSGRALKTPSDILLACTGALNQITRNTGVTFTFGLPRIDILRALNWRAHHKHRIRRRPGFPSWSWTGWVGRMEYSYWVGDMDAYKDLDKPLFAGMPRNRKRKRGDSSIESGLHAQNKFATILDFPKTDDGTKPILRVCSTVIEVKLKLVRRQGTQLKNLKHGSLQEKKAVGDHWTLLDSRGNPLADEVGEHPFSEKKRLFLPFTPRQLRNPSKSGR
jgi:hypothetical protein